MANKILFISLSNIGDALLSLPVLDCLRANFPAAQITVLAGSRPREIFENNPHIHKFIAYDKQDTWKAKIKLFNALRKEKFDLVVDLRNSFLGALLPAKYKISPFLKIPQGIKHMKDKHLYKIQAMVKIKNAPGPAKALYLSPADNAQVTQLLKENNINEADKLIVISPGARSHTKRWLQERFVELIKRLKEEFPAKIILVGDKDDVESNKNIAKNSGLPLLDLSAKTTLRELACLLRKAELLITNDSANLHMASYLNVPVVGIFGITDDEKYGPWSEGSYVVKKEISCRPCAEAQCKFRTLECLSLVQVDDVFRAAKDILTRRSLPLTATGARDFKRILIVRTDRIGDVLLSTPVIKALRDKYPHAYIAMMVSPYARDIVEGNPYLDKVIIYDKDKLHKSWLSSLRFARGLKKKKFDLALILHPSNRAHLVSFLAGIPRRAGYDRKLGFLLTDRIRHTKQKGEKHELEYNLDLLRYLGIEPQDKNLYMPIKAEAEKWVKELFRQEGVHEADRLLAIHPAASCPSKIWPAERFATAADNLAQKYGFKILIVAGPKDLKLAEALVKNMRSSAINLAGKTSVAQLASLLKRCTLFISNDSGPVHIASSLGTPVISIFGRKQAGLGPRRWGPLGLKDKILHKDAGCIECLAHNCQKQFACLKALSVADVVSAADAILS
ncbi:MAG: lipopolysaccharide heptosyltransferase II [Candidatus Omnitrophica bacterium]|nr:lipopolysaccharide heptosyltransferase II [Candidatus Omnitrophota bacterium]